MVYEDSAQPFHCEVTYKSLLRPVFVPSEGGVGCAVVQSFRRPFTSLYGPLRRLAPRQAPLARAVCSCLLADFVSADSCAFHFLNVRFRG